MTEASHESRRGSARKQCWRTGVRGFGTRNPFTKAAAASRRRQRHKASQELRHQHTRRAGGRVSREQRTRFSDAAAVSSASPGRPAEIEARGLTEVNHSAC